MEKKVLKWTSVCSSLLTAAICVCLYFLPSEKEAWAAALGFRTQETLIEIEEETTVTEKVQLNIEIPEGMDGRDITITNDYLNHRVLVRFAHGVDNYSEKYSVKGGIKHIASLSYYKEGEEGVLDITFDKVCEISYIYKNGYICIDIVDPHELYDKIIVVDAGHGGRMPGAVKRGIYEKTINLAIVKELKALFEEAGDKSIKVYYTRLDDSDISLVERANLANYADADLFISVHNNASSQGWFNYENGTLGLYSPDDEGEYSSKRLAQICVKAITESTGSQNLGISNGDEIYIVRSSKVPVVLLEAGYMSNIQELERLTQPEYQKKIAQGIYNGIMQALEEGF